MQRDIVCPWGYTALEEASINTFHSMNVRSVVVAWLSAFFTLSFYTSFKLKFCWGGVGLFPLITETCHGCLHLVGL